MKTTKEKIKVMQAFVDGKKIEHMMVPHDLYAGGPWGPTGDLPYEPLWDWVNYDYRIANKPKLRPWKPEEVPVLAMLRPKGAAGFRRDTICSVTPDGYIYIGNGYIELTKVVDTLEHSTDGGKTWQPCGVLE